MRPSYTLEQYQLWTNTNSITFQRKLVYETAFDGIVKIYALRTNLESINKKLVGNFFGEFSLPTEKGIFLRMFENIESWPKTSLVYLDFKKSTVTEINKNKSSWNIWKGQKLENGKYSIEITPEKSIECEIIYDDTDNQTIKVNGKLIPEKRWWKFW